MKKLKYEKMIKEALLEDMPFGDITTEALGLEDKLVSYSLISKDKGIFAGRDIFEAVFHTIDMNIDFSWNINDGAGINIGDELCIVTGKASSILKGERIALNFVQRMCGIATKTRQYVNYLANDTTKIVDTRKTTPLLRIIEKEAVRIGGGHNHRMNLSDAVMIKDNHISACGSISEAVKRVKTYISHTTKVEVEVETIHQVEEAINAKVDIIMLDNMSNDLVKEALSLEHSDHIIFEVSGNITEERITSLSQLGVDIISVGAITYQAGILDLSMKKRGLDES